MRHMRTANLGLALLAAFLPQLAAAGPLGLFGGKTLEIYSVDVEGGQATLIVSPSAHRC